MGGFTGLRNVSSEELPDVVTLMGALPTRDVGRRRTRRVRRRIQCDSFGQRGGKADPLYEGLRTLHTGSGLLTEEQ